MTDTLKNLCVNPLLKTSGLTVETGCTLAYLDKSSTMRMDSTGDNAGRVSLPPIDLTPYFGKRMVMSVETDGDGTISEAALCYVRFNTRKPTSIGTPRYVRGAAWPSARVTYEFTCPDKASGATTFTPVLTSMAGAGKVTYYARLIVCTQEDYTKLQTTGLNYFDYSTQPE